MIIKKSNIIQKDIDLSKLRIYHSSVLSENGNFTLMKVIDSHDNEGAHVTIPHPYFSPSINDAIRKGIVNIINNDKEKMQEFPYEHIQDSLTPLTLGQMMYAVSIARIQSKYLEGKNRH